MQKENTKLLAAFAAMLKECIDTFRLPYDKANRMIKHIMDSIGNKDNQN